MTREKYPKNWHYQERITKAEIQPEVYQFKCSGRLILKKRLSVYEKY